MADEDASFNSFLFWRSPALPEVDESLLGSSDDAAPVAASSGSGAVVSFAGQGLRLNTAEDAAGVVAALEAAPGGATEVELSGNTLGLPAMLAIVDALGRTSKTTLQKARLADIFTGRLPPEIHPSLAALGELFMDMPQLRDVDLGDNAVSLEGAKALAPYLATVTELKHLRLNNTGVGPAGGRIVGQALAMAADRGLRLETFVLGRSRLETRGAAAVGEAFKRMGSLRVIAMPQNGIRRPGIAALAEGLSACRDLEELDLNDNTFTARGGKSVAEALRSLPKLTKVNFGDCLLRNDGCVAVMEAWAAAAVGELDLTFNEISDKAVPAMAKTLASLSKLKRLELNGNAISSGGLDEIRAALAKAGVEESALGDTDEMESGDEEDEDEDDEDEEEDEDEDEEDRDQEEDVELASLLGHLHLDLGASKTPGNSA